MKKFEILHCKLSVRTVAMTFIFAVYIRKLPQKLVALIQVTIVPLSDHAFEE
jgi:hypothetical protein